MGHERAHAEFLGQGKGLLMVRFSGRDVQRVPTHGNLAEQPQGPRLHPPGFEIADLSEHSLATRWASCMSPARR